MHGRGNRYKRTRRAAWAWCADNSRSARDTCITPIRVVGHASAGGTDSNGGRRGRRAEVTCAHFFVAFVGAWVGLSGSCLEGARVGGNRKTRCTGPGWAASTICRSCFECAREVHRALALKSLFTSAYTDLPGFTRSTRASSRRSYQLN